MKKIHYDGLNITKTGFLHHMEKIDNRWYFKFRKELNFKTKKEATEYFDESYYLQH